MKLSVNLFKYQKGKIKKNKTKEIENHNLQINFRYEGSFENMNVTDIYLENQDDGIFRDFEDEYAYMESNVGRSDFTEEEQRLIRKFKLMKNMIIYLQQIPLFGKYCFYGCYCFSKGPKELLIDAGNGKPIDGVDNACRRHLVSILSLTFNINGFAQKFWTTTYSDGEYISPPNFEIKILVLSQLW